MKQISAQQSPAHSLSSFDWNDLKIFLAIARSGSIRGGAAQLGANHVTVSRRLAQLEAAIDARLFDRTRSGLVMTQLGEDLLPRAILVEREVAAASRLVAGRDAAPAGPIQISMPPFMGTTLIMDELAAFSAQYPDIEICLSVSNDIADLDRREADVSIRYAHEVTDDVVGRRTVQCAKAVYCSKDYAAQMRDDGGKGCSWIGWIEPLEDRSAAWIRSSPFPNAVLRHRIGEAVPHLALAAAGAGLTMLPCFAGDRHPGLVRAPYQEPVLDRSIWLLLHGDLRQTARIRLFIDFMVARIRARRAELQGEHPAASTA